MSQKMTVKEYRALQPNLPGTRHASHSNLGKDFESELVALHDFYRLNGTIDVVQNPSEWAYAKGRDYHAAKANYERNQPNAAKTGDKNFYLQRVYSDIDFSGGNGSMAVCFDAKESKGNSIPLKNFKEHQVHRLKQSAKCGTLAGFMVKMTELKRVFFVPVGFVSIKMETHTRLSFGRKAAPKGTASISIEEMERNGTEIFERNNLWDWFYILGKK